MLTKLKNLIIIGTIVFSCNSFADDTNMNDVLNAEAVNILSSNPQIQDDSNSKDNEVISKKGSNGSFSQYSTDNKNGKRPNYFVEAGKYYGVSPWLLWSVGKVESNHNPYAINKNKNGTYDIGIMQINSIHLKELAKYDIKRNDLFNTKTNIYVGAMIMRECIDRWGQNWNAVSCYNGMSPENRKQFVYAKKVYKALKKGMYVAQKENE